MRTQSYGLLAFMFAGAALVVADGVAAGETYPDAVTASPKVYKVIAESGDLRMVLATYGHI